LELEESCNQRKGGTRSNIILQEEICCRQQSRRWVNNLRGGGNAERKTLYKWRNVFWRQEKLKRQLGGRKFVGVRFNKSPPDLRHIETKKKSPGSHKREGEKRGVTVGS